MKTQDLLHGITDFEGLSVSLLKEHAALSRQYSSTRDDNKNLYLENIQLKHALYKHTKGRFGVKSEKFKMDFYKSDEPNIFDDIDITEAEEDLDAADTLITVPEHTREKKRKNIIPGNLPTTIQYYDLPDDEKICKCGCALAKIGEDTYSQIDYIPASSTVIKHVKAKYACRACEETIITAKMPRQPIPKGIATPGTLAAIVVSKYIYHLPLYRQEMLWRSQGINLPRCLMSNWMIKVGKLIDPLVFMLKVMLVSSNNYIQADETSAQVLKEPGKKATSKSYIWLYKTGVDKNGIVIFEYQPGRAGKHATNFLQDFSGYLQTDGYAGYDQVSRRENIIRMNCWAHVRRYFVDIYKSSKNSKGSASAKAIHYIGKLYKVEKQIKNLSDEEKRQHRQAKSKVIFEKFFTWLQSIELKCPPQSAIGKAVNYALQRKESLGVYLDHGFAHIDNNPSENKIRPFVVGRKNWLFMGNVDGAKASCALYSLLTTAQMHGHDPYDYFKTILTKIPQCENKDELARFLPMNLDPEDCKFIN